MQSESPSRCWLLAWACLSAKTPTQLSSRTLCSHAELQQPLFWFYRRRSTLLYCGLLIWSSYTCAHTPLFFGLFQSVWRSSLTACRRHWTLTRLDRGPQTTTRHWNLSLLLMTPEWEACTRPVARLNWTTPFFSEAEWIQGMLLSLHFAQLSPIHQLQLDSCVYKFLDPTLSAGSRTELSLISMYFW